MSEQTNNWMTLSSDGGGGAGVAVPMDGSVAAHGRRHAFGAVEDRGLSRATHGVRRGLGEELQRSLWIHVFQIGRRGRVVSLVKPNKLYTNLRRMNGAS